MSEQRLTKWTEVAALLAQGWHIDGFDVVSPTGERRSAWGNAIKACAKRGLALSPGLDDRARRAVDMLNRVVSVMRACDPEYCASHEIDAATDDEWDDTLGDAEALLDELEAIGPPGEAVKNGL
jgi:hypothetical protein